MAARMAERWYARCRTLLDHQLRGRQPLILYASGPHFRQTNVDRRGARRRHRRRHRSAKRRIVLPFAGPIEATDHVLGHELVHAFQYDITEYQRELRRERRARRCRCGSSRAWPSTCRSVRSMRTRRCGCATRRGARSCRTSRISTTRSYFPYRYGQALWAFIGGKLRRPRDRQPAAGCRSDATDTTARSRASCGVDSKELSKEWHDARARRLPADRRSDEDAGGVRPPR